MKCKILIAILTIACAGVAYAYEPCGVYEETVQPCAPIETVQPCEPVQTGIEPCAPVATIEPCAPVVGCVECVGVKTVVCEVCPCQIAKVTLRRDRRVKIETSVAQQRSCLARIFARKSVSIERKVKIETE